MALTKGVVLRDDDVGGLEFLVLLDGSVRRAQAMGLVNEDGNHAGIPGEPLIARPDYLLFGKAVNADSAIIKASGGVLGGIKVNFATATPAQYWLQVFNSATLPADTTVPDAVFTLPVSTLERNVQLPHPISLGAGISVALSTTMATKTITSGAGGFFEYLYA